MGPWWWWWAGRFTLLLAFVFLFCSFSLVESLLSHWSVGCKQPRVTTHLTHFPASAADTWKILLTAPLTTISAHLCMIYISLYSSWNWRSVASTNMECHHVQKAGIRLLNQRGGLSGVENAAERRPWSCRTRRWRVSLVLATSSRWTDTHINKKVPNKGNTMFFLNKKGW